MMMFVSLDDVRRTAREALRRSAKAVGIDPITKDPATLLALIKEQNPVVYDALVAFVVNLRGWYDMHVEIETEGKAGKLNASEFRELARRIDEKKGSAEYLASLVREE
jgi:hypothetical protein